MQQKYFHFGRAIQLELWIKPWLKLWPIFLVLLIGACVSQPAKTPEFIERPLDAGDILFQKGEAALADKDLDLAQSIFTNYLGQYPQGRRAPDAWHLIGKIYAQMGEDGPAEAFYLRAVELFPQSPAAARARLGMADLYVKRNRIEDAIHLCLAVLETDPEMEIRIDAWQRLVHLYQVTGNPANVALYANLVYKNVPPPEDEMWQLLLKEAISQLDIDDIDAVWDRIADLELRSFLMYRYATLEVERENYTDALAILSAFRGAFPEHPFASDAEILIQNFTQQLLFEPYTVGCLLPLSGAYEIYGRRALNAIEMALSLLQTGEAALPIRLVVKDTASDDGVTIQGVRSLVQEGAGVILGPITTASAAAREAQRLNIPMVTFTQKPGITQSGDFIFRHFISPHNQVRTLIDYFIHHLALNSFAIMYPRESYGTTFMNLFWEEVVTQGGRVVGVEGYDPKQTDFGETIKKLVGTYYDIPSDLQAHSVVQVEASPYYRPRSVTPDHLEEVLPDPVTRLTGLFFQDVDQDRVKGPALGRISEEEQDDGAIIDFDVLFIPDAPKATGLILPQLAFHDVKNVYMVGTNLWHSKSLIDMSRQYAQSAVMVDGFFIDSASAEVRRFVETYRSIYGQDPGLVEAFAFDTSNLIFTLMARQEIRMRNELRDAMKEIYLARGVTGPTTFSHDGEANKRLSLLRIKGDRFVQVAQP